MALPPLPPQAKIVSLVADLLLTCPTLVSSTKACILHMPGNAWSAAAGKGAVVLSRVCTSEQLAALTLLCLMYLSP